MPPAKRVLCFASYFLPGFRSGGPVRSLMNLFAGLKNDFEFRVVTRDRDLGDAAPYPDRAPGKWYPEGEVQIQYLARPGWTLSWMEGLLRDCKPDLLYFNSFMDPALSIAPSLCRRLGRVGRNTPVLIAPRGEFSPGALAIKRHKNAIYLRAVRATGFYADVTWHATSELERQHIQSWWGPRARIALAPNLPPATIDTGAARIPKQAGSLRMVFLSRIDRKKNLDGALRILAGLRVQVHFDIYGIREDAAYWDECAELISSLPANVSASYCGELAPGEVIATLSRYDLFFFPTLGENFGHVILEALLAGCPILISDRTPWRQLQAAFAGFDVPLNQVDEFRRAIESVAAMDAVEFSRWSEGARERGLAYCRGEESVRQTKQMLAAAINRTSPHG